MNIDELEPLEVMRLFKRLSDIPRGSGNEQAASNWIAEFARKRGLEVHQDELFNLLIKKSASLGCESAPIVILHGHIDMVCEKVEDSSHDFLRDPIDLQIDDDFIVANGTSLGADNGVGVAYILAILDSTELTHPPLEVVLTVMEEKGKVGGANFDADRLSGRRMVDFNWCAENVILAGCSGDLTLAIDFAAETERAPNRYLARRVTVSGLQGGHCEFDIARERANAIIALCRVLHQAREVMDIRLAEMDGGVQNSAIPSEASAVVLIEDGRVSEFNDTLRSVEAELADEYGIADPGLQVSVETVPDVRECQSQTVTNGLIDFGMLAPSGVISWSRRVEGLVEAANNLGTIRTEPGRFRFMTTITAAVTSRKHHVADRIALLAARLRARAEYYGLDAPELPYNPESPLLHEAQLAFAEAMGFQAEVLVSNCSLELGMFGEKLPGLDTISIGTEMSGMHSVAERVSYSSIGRVWGFTQTLMARLAVP